VHVVGLYCVTSCHRQEYNHNNRSHP